MILDLLRLRRHYGQSAVVAAPGTEQFYCMAINISQLDVYLYRTRKAGICAVVPMQGSLLQNACAQCISRPVAALLGSTSTGTVVTVLAVLLCPTAI